jgi:GH24 family phage-related lysozyme (muramidase)
MFQSRQQAVTLKTGDNVVLNANQYGALVSFTYNMGNGNFAESDLLSRLNAGEDEGTVIAEELPKWKYAGGRVFNGLVRRRKAEIALAQTATTEKALPVGCT